MKILIIGSGHRVQEAILPVIAARPNELQLSGIFSRTEKTLNVRNNTYQVKAITGLQEQDLADIDLLYCGVEILAVPEVIALLEKFNITNTDLLLDTPGLHVKNISLLERLYRFRNVWLAEDIVTLPWLETIEAAQSHYHLGQAKKLLLNRSGWEYHGIALTKKLLNGKVVKTRLKKNVSKTDNNLVLNNMQLQFDNNHSAEIIYPRDYDVGTLSIELSQGNIGTDEQADTLRLEGIVKNRQCIGFQIGEVSTFLGEHEIEIFGELAPDTSSIHIIRHMHDCKRVGLSRLIDNIIAGKGAYPIIEGMDDLWIGYITQVAGRWFTSPFSNVRYSIFRTIAGFMWSLKRLLLRR